MNRQHEGHAGMNCHVLQWSRQLGFYLNNAPSAADENLVHQLVERVKRVDLDLASHEVVHDVLALGGVGLLLILENLLSNTHVIALQISQEVAVGRKVFVHHTQHVACKGASSNCEFQALQHLLL